MEKREHLRVGQRCRSFQPTSRRCHRPSQLDSPVLRWRAVHWEDSRSLLPLPGLAKEQRLARLRTGPDSPLPPWFRRQGSGSAQPLVRKIRFERRRSQPHRRPRQVWGKRLPQHSSASRDRKTPIRKLRSRPADKFFERKQSNRLPCHRCCAGTPRRPEHNKVRACRR